MARNNGLTARILELLAGAGRALPVSQVVAHLEDPERRLTANAFALRVNCILAKLTGDGRLRRAGPGWYQFKTRRRRARALRAVHALDPGPPPARCAGCTPPAVLNAGCRIHGLEALTITAHFTRPALVLLVSAVVSFYGAIASPQGENVAIPAADPVVTLLDGAAGECRAGAHLGRLPEVLRRATARFRASLAADAPGPELIEELAALEDGTAHLEDLAAHSVLVCRELEIREREVTQYETIAAADAELLASLAERVAFWKAHAGELMEDVDEEATRGRWRTFWSALKAFLAGVGAALLVAL